MDKFSEQHNPARGGRPSSKPRSDRPQSPRPTERGYGQRAQPGNDRRSADGRENARRGFERRHAAPQRQSTERGNDPVWHRDVGQPAKPSDPTTFRLFVALMLPQAVIEEIASFINEMPTMAAQNVRWIPRENVHMTLMFLGDTSTELLPQLKERLIDAASNTSPFSLRLGETGAFPSYHTPKILWVGLAGEVRKLVQLQGRVEGSLRTMGFEPEHRAFKPHITVGRTVRDLTRQFEGDVGFSWRRSVLPATRAEIPVTEIKLLRSRLQTGGAVYTPIFSAPLGK